MAIFMTVVSVLFIAVTVGCVWFLRQIGREMLRDWLGRFMLSLVVILMVLCGTMAWMSGVEAYDRFTIQPEDVTVTIFGKSVPETTYVTTTTMVGQTAIVQVIPVDTTSFSCREIEGRLSCGGHYHWSDGDKVRMRLFKRAGKIRTYDVLGLER